MKKLLVFGGTTEGRLLAEFCGRHDIPAAVSVATDYGSEIFSADIIYLARSDEEKAAYEEKIAGATELTPELQAVTDEYYDNRNPGLVSFVCAGKAIDSQKIIDTVLYGFPTKEFTQVGETDKYNLVVWGVRCAAAKCRSAQRAAFCKGACQAGHRGGDRGAVYL